MTDAPANGSGVNRPNAVPTDVPDRKPRATASEGPTADTTILAKSSSRPTGDIDPTGRDSLRGGVLITASKFVVVVVGLAGTAVLARVLHPADFGLVAKVTALTGLVNLLSETGTAIAIVQAPSLSQRQRSAFFWCNSAVALLLAILLAIVSPFISAFYGDTRVLTISLAIAVAVGVRCVGVVPMSLLRRERRFGTLAAIQVTATSLSIATAIGLSGVLGFWALVIQVVVLSVANTLLAIAVAGGLPPILFRGAGIRRQFNLGMGFNASAAINYFSRNLDNILIGKFIGEVALANYTKAYGLLMLPLSQIAQPISQVAVPTLSRLQDRPDEYRRQFLTGASLSFLVQIPAAVFVACAAEPMVLTMLGDQWTDAVPIFYALAPAVLVSTTAPGSYWIVPSLGLAGRQFWLVCINTTAIVAAITIGLRYGVIGVAYGFSVASVLMRYPSLCYSMKPSPVGVHEFLATGLVPLAASVIAGASCMGAAAPWEPTTAPIALVYRGSVFITVYVACVMRTSPGRQAWAMTRRHLLPKLPGRLAGWSSSS